MGIVQIFALFVASSLLCLPLSVRGLQCPTAPVQVVRETVQDGSLTIERAPREGEPGFKQCHCAEKKAGQTQEAIEDRGFASLPPVTAPALFRLTPPSPIQAGPARFPSVAVEFSDTPNAPPVPPPDFI